MATRPPPNDNVSAPARRGGQSGGAGRCLRLRQGEPDPRRFQVAPDAFDAVPGKPFAYWVSEAVRQTFKESYSFERGGRFVKHGLTTGNDDRFVRAWLEPRNPDGWLPFAKGGSHSPYYADQQLVLNWHQGGAELRLVMSPSQLLVRGLMGISSLAALDLLGPLGQGGFRHRPSQGEPVFLQEGIAHFSPKDANLLVWRFLTVKHSTIFSRLLWEDSDFPSSS